MPALWLCGKQSFDLAKTRKSCMKAVIELSTSSKSSLVLLEVPLLLSARIVFFRNLILYSESFNTGHVSKPLNHGQQLHCASLHSRFRNLKRRIDHGMDSRES